MIATSSTNPPLATVAVTCVAGANIEEVSVTVPVQSGLRLPCWSRMATRTRTPEPDASDCVDTAVDPPV